MHFDTLEGPRNRVHLVKAGMEGGEPLLLIHGAPGSWEDWKGLIEGPSRLETYNIWAVDRPGFGLSEKSDFDASFESKIEDLVFVARQLALASGGKALWIAGHSYGAALASRVAYEVSRFATVAGVVLVSGVLCQWSNHPRWYNLVVSDGPVSCLVSRRYVRGAREMNRVRKGLLELVPLWPDFPCPIGLVHCEDDSLVICENSEYVSEQANRMVRHETWLRKVGHRVPQKRPDVIKDVLLSMYSSRRDAVLEEEVARGLN